MNELGRALRDAVRDWDAYGEANDYRTGSRAARLHYSGTVMFNRLEQRYLNGDFNPPSIDNILAAGQELAESSSLYADALVAMEESEPSRECQWCHAVGVESEMHWLSGLIACHRCIYAYHRGFEAGVAAARP